MAGNLRVDYVLPSAGLKVTGAGVFWPVEGEPGAALIDASDHRLVWVDVVLPATASAPPGPTPATPPRHRPGRLRPLQQTTPTDSGRTLTSADAIVFRSLVRADR